VKHIFHLRQTVMKAFPKLDENWSHDIMKLNLNNVESYKKFNFGSHSFLFVWYNSRFHNPTRRQNFYNASGKLSSHYLTTVCRKDMGGSQRDNDSSPNLSLNDLKQKEIEIKEGSARVLWYERQLLIGQPKWG